MGRPSLYKQAVLRPFTPPHLFFPSEPRGFFLRNSTRFLGFPLLTHTDTHAHSSERVGWDT